VQRGRRSLVADPGAAGALSAETRWEPVAVAGQVTLLRATTSTGRMHQVRAHLAAAGHPLIGDPLYGGPAEVDLPVLHAEWIALPHPDSGARLEVRAPLPADRRALLERLGLPPLG
jgi:23S rRNA-/tRNA-specific pseudouridylate synthase